MKMIKQYSLCKDERNIYIIRDSSVLILWIHMFLLDFMHKKYQNTVLNY